MAAFRLRMTALFSGADPTAPSTTHPPPARTGALPWWPKRPGTGRGAYRWPRIHRRRWCGRHCSPRSRPWPRSHCPPWECVPEWTVACLPALRTPLQAPYRKDYEMIISHTPGGDQVRSMFSISVWMASIWAMPARKTRRPRLYREISPVVSSMEPQDSFKSFPYLRRLPAQWLPGRAPFPSLQGSRFRRCCRRPRS